MATGNNAWGQLDLAHGNGDVFVAATGGQTGEPEDLWTFKIVLSGVDASAVRAGNFRTHVKTSKGYIAAGDEDLLLEMIEYGDEKQNQTFGRRWPGLVDRHTPDLHERVGIAMSGAGRIVDINGVQSQTFFGVPNESRHHQDLSALPFFPKDASQIMAGATHFACLANGSIYTWGDARHPSPLGRTPLDADDATCPSLVTELDDLPDEQKASKIAAGGYITAALTHGGDCYIWGNPAQGWKAIPEPVDFDVVDVAVAEECVILVVNAASEREVWVKGKGRNGELGLGKGVEETQNWTKADLQVSSGKEVQEVVAGGRCVLLLIGEKGKRDD